MTVYDIIKELGIKTCWCSVYGEVHVICLKDIKYIDLLLKENDGVVMRLDGDGKLDDKGECLIFPSKNDRDWDKALEEKRNQLLFPFNTLVMVSDGGLDWRARYYKKGKQCGLKKENNDLCSWNYIVPISNFDFNADDLSINIKNSI